MVDFHHKKPMEGVVERIEYDPNRSARIALVREVLKGTILFCSVCERVTEIEKVGRYSMSIVRSRLAHGRHAVTASLKSTNKSVQTNEFESTVS